MAKRAVKRTIEEIVKPKQSKATVTDAGFEVSGGILRYNGRPTYAYENDELVPLFSLKDIKGRDVWWRPSEIMPMQYVEAPDASL